MSHPQWTIYLMELRFIPLIEKQWRRLNFLLNKENIGRLVLSNRSDWNKCYDWSKFSLFFYKRFEIKIKLRRIYMLRVTLDFLEIIEAIIISALFPGIFICLLFYINWQMFLKFFQYALKKRNSLNNFTEPMPPNQLYYYWKIKTMSFSARIT